jgi:phytoene dehydrogenase-like protein
VSPDAVVIGAGPNGLTAAITLVRAGLDVEVFEARPTIGGGASTRELTLPGFRHDPCSAVHPLGIGSPVFRSLPLTEHGLRWVQPELPLVQTLAGDRAATLYRDLAATAAGFGADARTYGRLLEPFAGRWSELAADVLRPPAAGLPRHPLLLARFGARAVRPASSLMYRFSGEGPRAVIAGLAAHGLAPLNSPLTGGIAMMFAAAGHEVGWPVAQGGSQAISDALGAVFQSLGGRIHLSHPITSIDELPAARAYLFDVSPRALAAIAGSRLSDRWVRRMRAVSYGPAVFKIDYALDGPVPWTNSSARRAGTVHVGATAEEIGRSLHAANHGRAPEVPFLITSQPTVFDPSRAPAGQHVFWVYGHVPNGWPGNALPAIERQLERFAPGFCDRVLARHVTAPAHSEAMNPNYVGGNIAVGRSNGLHGFLRPFLPARVPYASGNRSIYLCSAATTPGPGVHGMCGYHAARAALARVWHIRAPRLDQAPSTED